MYSARARNDDECGKVIAEPKSVGWVGWVGFEPHTHKIDFGFLEGARASLVWWWWWWWIKI